jgi:hypothetical protein
MRRFKLLATGLVAVCALAVTTGAASARRFELSSQSFRIVWTIFRVGNEGAGEPEIRCPITLEGTFHSRTFSKVANLQIGVVTRAIASTTRPPCSFNNGAEAFRLLEATVPWEVLYVSFTGTLPRIERIRLSIVGFAFLITFFTRSCLYQPSAGAQALGDLSLSTETGEVSRFRWDETRPIPGRLENPFPICPGTERLEGTGTVTVLNSTTRITIRLVQ